MTKISFRKQLAAGAIAILLGTTIYTGISHAADYANTDNANTMNNSNMDNTTTGNAAPNNNTMQQQTVLNQKVNTTLRECQHISTSCAAATKKAAGVLVFPSVVKADLIIGGSGGKGALVENGQITGYYNIGSASAGLQAGVDKASQVYVFSTQQAMSDLKQNSDWKVGASAGVTVVSKDANARGMTGDVLAYIFDAKGLHGGVSLELFDIWKSESARPQISQN